MYAKYLRVGDKVIYGEAFSQALTIQRIDFNSALLTNGVMIPVDKLRPYLLRPWQVGQYLITRHPIETIVRFMAANNPKKQRRVVEDYLKNPHFKSAMCIETGAEGVEIGDIQKFITGVLDHLDDELRHFHVT